MLRMAVSVSVSVFSLSLQSMANRTVRDAVSVHGTNPQYLIEKILRERIVEDAYWKEHCFALTAESVIDKAVELAYVGGTFGQHVKPSPFLCLTLKLLQLQPSHDIIMTYIENTDFKYLRALGAFYLRLTAQSLEIYEVLEPLYTDFRKLRTRNKEGEYGLTHMDEFIDRMLRDDRVCDVALPRLMQRHVLEVSGQLEPRVSVLEEDMEDNEEAAGDDSADDGEAEKPESESDAPFSKLGSSSSAAPRQDRSRSRSRSPDSRHQSRYARSRSRSPSRDSAPRHRGRSQSRSRSRSPPSRHSSRRSRSRSPRRSEQSHRSRHHSRSRSRSRSPSHHHSNRRRSPSPRRR
ncbi:pre-mRNA-splicing factor 38A [Capsaspora owczarzaki ATCC 30864]|uniref:pre-mRNA-splicing factor 38A n=1 Tax=Capsaspora owczarzaki (strain ATCC 30864) TaxID=595528 RepID=UPI0003525A5B|nr:pre-mRNA-splicing factor 38A [Capsaspora owczarzaki ATCC 30864]|eukprot:XP_004348268.2 pre-mRNA-splicing factor 38A [Capsaspora owczarzaki ATCC 30864]